MKGIRFWIPFIYKKNHNAYLIHLYGAYSLFFATNWWPGENVTSIRNAYALHLENIRQIDSEKSPCEESNMDIDMEGCLQKYMESQICSGRQRNNRLLTLDCLGHPLFSHQKKNFHVDNIGLSGRCKRCIWTPFLLPSSSTSHVSYQRCRWHSHSRLETCQERTWAWSPAQFHQKIQLNYSPKWD